MRPPRYIFYDRTWLGYLNYYLLRWFFIRLAYSVSTDFTAKINTTVSREKITFENVGNYYSQKTTWSIIFRVPWRR